MNVIRSRTCQWRTCHGLILVMAILFGLWRNFERDVVQAQNPSLAEDVLKKVKSATVSLRVKFESGTEQEGTGWFVEPGLIATNAHVVGFLGAASQKPQSIQIVVNGGETDSKTLVGSVAAADVASDLALLRVRGTDLPEPLRLGATRELLETQEVLIFGFPFGKRLGTAITVSKSSITSLRRMDGQLNEIQVNGGIHPGNSGGPVVNQRGEVIGVAVSAIAGTTIHQVIPSDKLSDILNGKVNFLQSQLAYIEEGQMKIPLRISIYDPLNRIKNLQVEHWTGAIGKTSQRPASRVRPEPTEGDTEIQTVDVRYESKVNTFVDVPVVPLTDEKQCYWMRVTGLDGTSQPFWSAAIGNQRPVPVERREATVKFQPKAGPAASMQLSSDSTFQVQVAGAKEKRSMNVKVVTKPTIMAPNDEGDLLVKLRFSSVAMGMKVNGESVNVKEIWAPLSQGFLKTTATVEYGDDGSVITSQSDVKKVSTDLQKTMSAISDQILQSIELMSVPLPDGTIRPMEKVRAQRTLLVGLPGLFVPVQADTKYRFLGVRPGKDGQETAVFEITGSLRPRRGDEGKIAGKITGNVDLLTSTGEVYRGFAIVIVEMGIAETSQFQLSGTLAIGYQPTLSAAPKVSGTTTDQ